MRKSLILATLLFGSSAFASVNCTPYAGQVWKPYASYPSDGSCYSDPIGIYGNSGGNYPASDCDASPDYANYHVKTGSCANDSSKYSSIYYQSSPSCSAGSTLVGNVCQDPNFPEPQSLDPNHPLGDHDGDEPGCNSAGGYYMASTKCNTLGEAVADIYGSPYAVAGAFLTIGGAIVGSAGMAAVPLTAGASGGVAGVGAWAFGVGLGMMGISGANTMFNSTSDASQTDVTNGTQRIKLSLKSVSGGSASVVTNTSTTTKKVDSVSYIPPTVKAEMAKSEYVNKTDGTLSKPLPMDGVQSTVYNYTTNKATTTTHEAGSTSAAPITTTRTTPITVVQNPDGTVTTVPTDTTIAPIVSGSGGGSVSASGSSTWGTGTGTTSGDGNDYTGVLNDIKKNTGDSAGFLSDILGKFDNDTEVNTALSDGSDGFDGYQGDIEGSFDGFIYTDPLGLNNIAGGSSIPEYGFTIMGTHFIIMDQALLNQLPLDLLRGLFLFMAALAGFITVFSGV